MALEDFTTYTEVDPLGHLTVTANFIDADSVTGNEDTYVYFDKGAGHFGATFDHDFSYKIVASQDNTSYGGGWAVSNTLDDINAWKVGLLDGLAFYADHYGGSRALNVRNTKTGGLDYMICAVGTTYYLSAERTSDTAFQCRVYSNAARTTLLDTLLLTIGAGTTYRYIFGSESYDADKTQIMSFDVRDLDLQEAGLTITDAGAIATAEAFASSQLNLLLSNFGGIASAEAFGAPQLNLLLSGAGAIGSAEVFSSPQLNFLLSGAGAIASAETFGAAQLNLSLFGAGAITSDELFGSPQLNLNVVDAGAMASGEAFGTPSFIVWMPGTGSHRVMLSPRLRRQFVVSRSHIR